MQRREFLAGLGAAAAAAPGMAQSRAKKPNFVFVLADDLGYGDLSCYGQTMFETPNLDRLAKEGTRFDAAYAGSTVCAPSRCSLMTGMHTGHCRIRGNGKNETVLRKSDLVIPEMLKANGYNTGMFGKWALGTFGYPGHPNDKGWDEFYGYFSQFHAHQYYPHMLMHNRKVDELRGNWGTQRKEYAPDVIHRKTMEWLEKQSANEPFFLYYTSTIPHTDNELGRDTGNGQVVPEDAPFSGKPWPQVERNFAAMIHRLDRQVGDLVDTLKQRGMYENTVIVFTSDNGAHNEGGHSAKFFNSSGAVRGIKRDLTDGGIRVPAFAIWANQIPAGTVNKRPWAFWDVMPTFAEAAGIPTPLGLDGVSVLADWMGKGPVAHPHFYWEFHEGGFAQAVRRDNWKLIKQKNNTFELYDIVADVNETNNLAGANPKLVEELRLVMRNSRVDSQDWPVAAELKA
ncbi:arylsulfatase [Oscillatoria amoena NRMC-F 0135]|nr:arylsulfatase [Oscillatoria amoena NRMC-F 0135]